MGFLIISYNMTIEKAAYQRNVVALKIYYSLFGYNNATVNGE